MTINYEEIGREIGKLVSKKQKAYGDSYGNSGKILSILFPNGVKPEHYQELLAICRVIDKLFRLANDPGYGGESPWGDIVGYGLLRLGKQKEAEPVVDFKTDPPKDDWKVNIRKDIEDFINHSNKKIYRIDEQIVKNTVFDNDAQLNDAGIGSCR